jgi:hypothetical protein
MEIGEFQSAWNFFIAGTEGPEIDRLTIHKALYDRKKSIETTVMEALIL